MLVFRILATIFMGISCVTALVKNINIYAGRGEHSDVTVIISTIYGWAWRAFVIVAIWLI